jgi:thioredoxin reductase
MKTDLAVIGAGPAGLCAAIEAAKMGAQVLLIDENRKAGGQLFKQIHRFFGSEEHLAGIRGIDIGTMLLDDAERYGVNVLLNTVVWGLFPDSKIGISDGEKVSIVDAQRIIVSTGASENSLSFGGWTLPNIMGAGATQTMINVHRVLPGKRVLVIGSGNVGLIVAYQLLQAGASVIAVVEALPNVRGYQVHASKIVRMGIPILTNHTIVRAEGDSCVEEAVISEIDKGFKPVDGSEISFELDLICIAVGLRPLSELCWMSGMHFDYEPLLGGFVPLHDEYLQSSIDGVYVAGDVSGVEEASTAMEEGKLAAAAACMSLVNVDKSRVERNMEKTKERLRALRLGPYGEHRHTSKQRIIDKFHTMERG